MNLLPFVTIFLLVISLAISSFFEKSKKTTFSHISSIGLINAYRAARNASEEEKFASITPSTPTSKESTPRKPRSSTKKGNSDFRMAITENSKLNFTAIVKNEAPFLEEIFFSLLKELYLTTALFEGCPYNKEELLKDLSQAVILVAKKASPPLSSFEDIVLSDPKLHAVWYRLLKGIPNTSQNQGYPPLSRFVLIKKEEDKTLLSANKASIPLLKAFFGEEIATAILHKEAEEGRPRATITKEELSSILNHFSFPSQKRAYMKYGPRAITRHTKVKTDPASGVTADISFAAKEPPGVTHEESSCETPSPSQPLK